MHNVTSCFDPIPILSSSCHGRSSSRSSCRTTLLLPPPCRKEDVVMFLLHAFNSFTFLLLLFHLLIFLLIKLFTLIHSYTKRDVVEVDKTQIEEPGDVDVDVDVDGGGGEEEEGIFFWFEDSLLVDQGEEYSIQQHCLEVENTTFVEESPCISPMKNLAPVKVGIDTDDVLIADVLTPSDCGSPNRKGSSTPPRYTVEEEEEEEEEEVEKKEESRDKFFVDDSFRLDSKRFRFEDGSSLVGESTSKSSMEWQSSTITKDSETEYPFSSSSRRSSSNWESYTLFRKYDEEMMYFNRITTQKLAETESFRSIKYQPRSISERIVHKLTTKPRSYPLGVRDPYQELESAYVAQICLTWEALNWNHSNFSRLNVNRDVDAPFCAAKIAQEFQQFEVLLQRFIENEPYEYGRRPEVYARMRILSPKLLLVPEFREAEKGKEELISSAEFLLILGQAIRTFMNFLKADRQNPYQKLKALMRKRSSHVDKTLLSLLKKANKRKKMRLKDLVKQRRCIKKRRLKVEEMEILMGLIDMTVVSRVLRMPEISEEQMHWCEEKMTKVRIGDGKIQRDSSPLFFPVH